MEFEQNLENANDYLPLQSFDHLYHQQHGNYRTPITTAMLSTQNLSQLLVQIGKETGDLCQCEVKVVPNSDLFSYMEQKLQETPNLATVQHVVQCLNSLIVQHEVAVHARGLRRRQLYLKWFIAKDRPVTISHPVSTNGRRRLDNPTTGDYGLNNPRRNAWKQFMWEQAQQ